ncbi:ABC transporter permease [Thalassococcus sp. S3]|uniref:ABC transporter permease n=1 Tax=Thalassococcus sp. S3 TaxID=2017482 RepID=UPI001C2CB868|nr:ABC transporter permease [Thalassococcus sp. S3]
MQHLVAECRLVLLILFRQPGFWVPTVLFPAMLYAFFGAQSGGGAWAANAMASFAVYAVVGVGFFQFGVSVAQDRQNPFSTWQRSLPGHWINQWIAGIFASLIFTILAVSMVIVTSKILTDVTLAPTAWARLIAVCLLSAIPATTMGVALGSVSSARAAVPVANLIFLPLAYLGGLWVPPMLMPPMIDAISQWTPTRAMGELGWAAVNATAWEPRHLALLLAWTLAAAALTWGARWRRHRARS